MGFIVLIFIFLFRISSGRMVISLSYCFGIDLLSYIIVLLSFWICFLMVLARESLYKNNNYWDVFLLIVIRLIIRLTVVFFTLNMFIFYLFFEIRLIPTLILIIG